MAEIDQAIRTLRVVAFGIAASLLTFAAVGAAFGEEIARGISGDVERPLLGILALVSAGSATAYGVMYRQIRGRLKSRVVELRAAPEPLALVLEDYRRLALVRGGVIEGPGFLAVITYVLTGSQLALAVAGLSVVLLLATIPSRAGLQRLADDITQA
jgi:hypothetical protein